MSELQEALLTILYILWGLGIFFTFCSALVGEIDYYLDCYLLSPNWLYKHSKMNKIGCWFISIIFAFITPLYFTLMVIYWLFHIGRD